MYLRPLILAVLSLRTSQTWRNEEDGRKGATTKRHESAFKSRRRVRAQLCLRRESKQSVRVLIHPESCPQLVSGLLGVLTGIERARESNR